MLLPLIQDILEEARREERVKILHEVLEARFGAVTPAVTTGLAQVKDEEKLARLTDHTATCPSRQAFEDALRQELPQPALASTNRERSRKSQE